MFLAIMIFEGYVRGQEFVTSTEVSEYKEGYKKVDGIARWFE